VYSEEGDEPVPEAEQCHTNGKLEEMNVTVEMVRKKIKGLKPASAPGLDGIGSMLLRELAAQVAGPLAIIFNKSLSTSEVPEDWKRANVTPIYKKGTKADPSNYRPVSLTSISCKMLESILRDSIVKHLEQNNLVESSQHGFVKTRSCATNLVEFLDHLTTVLEKGGTADAIFLDFAKAFDKVPRNRLLEKLRGVGLGGRVLAWIEE
jgi:Reverse transcriptase (RNA-dependent DNA polymerase)